MQINISGHHVDVTPPLHDYVADKLKKIEGHLRDVVKMEVTLEVEKMRHLAKGNIYVTGELLHAEADDDDMYAAIDRMTDKLHRQALKHKEKHQKHE